MSNKKLALQTIKSIEETSRTRSAFKYSRVRNLARMVSSLGFFALLLDLSPLAAQTLSMTGDVASTPYHAQKATIRKAVGRMVFTGERYTLKTGEVCDVYANIHGRKFVLRNGKRYYPKSLNK